MLRLYSAYATPLLRYRKLKENNRRIRIHCFYILRSSLTFTSRHLATSIRFSKLGCALLVHHLDTVAWSTPICSANHLLVRFFSASTTFKRFKSLLSMLHIHYIIHRYKVNDFLAEIIKFC